MSLTVPYIPSEALAPPVSAVLVVRLRTPPTPSASYLTPGFVTTWMSFIELAGIILKTIEAFCDIIWLGFPSTYTWKDELPFTVMLSCPSTVTIGTLRSMSSTVLV